MRRSRVGMGSLLAVMVVAAGCTVRAADHAGFASPTPRPAATSAMPVVFGTREISLGCSDALGVRPGETVDDVPFKGLQVMTGAPPRAEDVGLRLPAGLHWYFRKEPLAMLKGAGDFTVSVSGAGQALAWVPVVWTTGRDKNLAAWAASSVTLHSCPDRAAMFLGGVLAADLNTCVQLNIRQARHPQTTVRQRLDGSPCIG